MKHKISTILIILPAEMLTSIHYHVCYYSLLNTFVSFWDLFGKIAEYAQHNDAILLVIVPASQASEISSSRALKIAKEHDPESEYIRFFNLAFFYCLYFILTNGCYFTRH